MKTTLMRMALLSGPVAGLAGCGFSRFHSPSIDILGSYFPAWMICMLSGLALTVIARAVLAGLNLDKWLRPGAIVYPCLVTVFTMAVWLVFFQN